MNEHVNRYLNYYINIENPPEFAVFIRGNWGTGKSWFLDNFIQQNSSTTFLRVSLYGMGSFKDIDESIFQQLHPILSSKGMRLAGKVLKGLIKTTINLDLNGDKKSDVTINQGIPDIVLPEYLNNLDNNVIVFDDLERCSIPIEDLLGYINQFVENKGLKVIIVGNEEEIIKSDGESKKNKFAFIKEKLIGKSFDIKPDFDSSVDHFISQLTNTHVIDLLNSKKDIIKNIFETAGYNNLRHLKQSILDYERFHYYLPKIENNKIDLLNHIIESFFILSFELKKGDMIEKDINDFFLNFTFDENDKKPIDILRDKYSMFNTGQSPILPQDYSSFFIYGESDDKSIKNSIDSSKYYDNEKTPTWIKFWRLYDLDDDTFLSYYTNVIEDFKNFKFIDKYVIIHVTAVLLNYSELNLINLNQEDIIEYGKENILNLKEKRLLNTNILEELNYEYAYGLAFHSKRNPKFIEFLDFTKNILIESASDFQPENIEILISELKENLTTFYSKIVLVGTHHAIYYDIPILNYIDYKVFGDIWMTSSSNNKRLIANIFNKRYKHEAFILKLKNELSWIESLKDYIQTNYLTQEIKISSLILGETVLPSLEYAIGQLSKI
ncbi:P-loop NTPase fold protein [Flavobacterium sp. DGU11]|uniref:P-loop NTPase fold protein n=1 Tax=Flavobacterium arundinis TaxID=3139143 RepID=A0ABU9HWA8_9FLAO